LADFAVKAPGPRSKAGQRLGVPRRPPPEEATAESAAETITPIGVELEFEQIYREHFDFACRSLRLLGVATGGLEDAAQDVFGIASRRLVEFEGNSSVKTWIFAIVQRVAANHRRAHRRKQAPLEPLSLEAAAGAGPSPESEAEAAQSAALIQAFCDTLDEGRRALLVLGLIEGVPMRELASSLGIPLQTAYSRIRALRRSLELHLLQHEVDHG
jgi:RNA polymerase sigma-70 factor (ECF subfamily)